MNTLLRSSILALGFASFASQAESPVLPRAVTVDLRGGFTGFDEVTYKAFREKAGEMLAQGLVDHFVTKIRGLEGGGVYCLELAPAYEDVSLLLEPLRALDPQSETVFYDVQPSVGCFEP